MSESDGRYWFWIGSLLFVLGIIVGIFICINQLDEIREQKNILQTEVNTYRSLLLEVSQ